MDNNLDEYLEADFSTGKVYWKKVSKFHKDLLGKEAGSPVNHNGKAYWAIQFDGKKYKRHQIVFYLKNGRWPNGLIDHIDRDSLNDKPENLREADSLINARNHSRRNIRKVKTTGNYQVRLGQKTVGMTKTLAEAIKLYDEMRLKLWTV